MNSNDKVSFLHQALEHREKQVSILRQNYDSIFDQMNAEDNAAKINNYERQLELFEKDILKKLEICDRLRADLEKEIGNKNTSHFTNSFNEESSYRNEESSCRKLEIILLSHQDKISDLATAYNLIVPENLRNPDSTLKEMLYVLEHVVLNGNRPSNLVKFAAILSVQYQNSKTSQELTKWGKEQTPNFDEVCTQMGRVLGAKLKEIEASKQAQAYLMIVIKEPQRDSGKYYINGYLIPNETEYQRDKLSGYKMLEPKEKKAYSREELLTSDDELSQENKLPKNNKQLQKNQLAQLCTGYLKQCVLGYRKKPIIEVFLPRSLIQLVTVESFVVREGYEETYFPCIGHEYQIRLRSIERCSDRYGWKQEDWEDKWQQLNCKPNILANELVTHIDEKIDEKTSYANLVDSLEEEDFLAIKLNKPPEGPKIVSAMLDTAIPVGLWLRRSLPKLEPSLSSDPNIEQTNNLSSLLDGYLQELPHRVQQKRRETRREEYCLKDRHIGHHIVLLWEDPNRLPPKESEFTEVQ